MLSIRAAKIGDLQDLMELSAETGAGMTTMPVDLDSWQKKLKLTEASFCDELEDKGKSVFVLVLEDPQTKRVVGTSALIASVGSNMPFYSYKLSTQVMASKDLGINTTTHILNLVNDFTNCTELASLFLSASYRADTNFRGAGRFLSLARFLLIHDLPHYFSDRVFAELRGYVDENGESPFWNALGKKFFGLEYSRADLLSAVSGNQFISDLMPKHPIYLDLLPEQAQEVTGKTNPASEPARRLLEREGFLDTGYVDIFDAGPTLECRRQQIRSLSAAQTGYLLPSNNELTNTKELKGKQVFMVSNRNAQDYRVVLAEGVSEEEGLKVDQEALDLLQIDKQELVSWTLFGEITK